MTNTGRISSLDRYREDPFVTVDGNQTRWFFSAEEIMLLELGDVIELSGFRRKELSNGK